MNTKVLAAVSVSVAVVAASVAAVVVSMNRSAEARSLAEAAISEEATTEANRKAKAAEAQAETEKRRAAEANEKAAADRRAAEESARKRAEIEERTAAENSRTAEAEARKAEAASKEAQAKRDEAKRKAEEAWDARVKAEQDAKAEQAKSDAAAAKLETERLRAEKIIAEAKLKELLKIDFEAVQRELMAWRQDLDERERALAPEKTIADLSWAGGGDDSVIDSSGCVVKMVKEPYDPEKDMTLSEGSRRLAREQRLAREAVSGESSAVREKIVASLEKLYVEALRENRVIDAEFYRKTLKSLYPDWEFKVEK